MKDVLRTKKNNNKKKTNYQKKVNYAAHGYSGNFTLSTLDRHYEKDLSLDEAKELLRKCVHEMKTRFLINLPDVIVRLIDKDGVQFITL